MSSLARDGDVSAAGDAVARLARALVHADRAVWKREEKEIGGKEAE